jgi:hypothetical protein
MTSNQHENNLNNDGSGFVHGEIGILRFATREEWLVAGGGV